MSNKRVPVVLFASAFRLSGVRGGAESPNITHGLRADGLRTLCGRTGWVTEEKEDADVTTFDYLVCRKRAS